MAFVAKVVKKVVKGVTNLVTGVVNVVVDVVDWVVDDIIEPVVKGVGNVIQYALDDPIKTIATLAATFVSGGAYLWTIPLIEGASVLAKGGNIGDAVKAAVISYAGGKLGATTGQWASKAVADAGGSAIMANIVGAGTKSATTALVYGQDPLKAFATGGLQAGLAAGMGKISETMKEQYGSKFEDLQGGVKDTIFAGLAAELEGGNLSETQLGSIIAKYSGVGDAMNNFLTENAGFSDAQAAILTNATTAAVSKALAGNPDGAGEAFFGSISAAGAEALKTIIDKPVNRAIDEVSGAHDIAQAKAKALNDTVNAAKNAADKYNALQSGLAGKIQTQDGLKAAYDRANAAYIAKPSEATANAANAAADKYNDYASALEVDYNKNYKNQLASAEATFTTNNGKIETLQKDYDDSMGWVVSKTEDLDAALKPILSAADKAVALTLRPGIDEDKYRKLNGLDKNADVFDHYLRNQGNAQVFDPKDLGDKYSYDAATNRYFVETPGGRQEVDPYAESMAGAKSYDAPTMSALREKVAPVEFLGRITADMANILGDEAPQGGVILPVHFKALKDAGYNVTPYRDPTLGKLVDGTVEYDDMVQDFEAYKKRIGDEDLAMSLTVYDREYGVMSQPVAYTGKTFTLDGTTPITREIQNVIKEAGGYDDAYMQRYFPVGDMLDSREQGMLPPEVIDAFYDAGYTPPEYKAMDAVSQNIVNKVYTKDSPYDFDNPGDLLKDTVGLGVRAIGQLAETFNYANVASNWLGTSDLDIPNTWLGKAATFLEKTGMDMHSPQYQEALADYNQGYTDARSNTAAEYRAEYVAKSDLRGMSKTELSEFNAAADAYAEEKANSFVGGAKTVFGGIANAPGMFFNEFIASEVMQELPVLGAGLWVKSGSLAISKAAGKEIAESLATKLGVGAGVVLDFIEAFGGGAQQGVDVAYESYIRMNMRDGMDPPQRQQVEADAREYAQNAGMLGGVTNMMITGITMGLINANSFEKLITKASNADSTAFKRFVDGVEAVVKESGQEAAEEGGTAAAVGLWVGRDDPSVLASLPADISQGAILGGLAGGGTAGSLVLGENVFQSTGNPVTDMLIRTSPTVQNLVYPEYAPPGTTTATHKNPDELKKALQGMGISDTEVLNNLLNTTYDAQFVTTTEAGDMFVKANPGFTPTDAEIAKFAGTRDEAKLAADVAAYVDPRFLDADEVKAAAFAEGITLTDEQADAYVGRKNENSAVTSIRKEYDPKATSYAEAEKFFSDLGFTPTKAQIDQFVGAKPENTQKTAINAYVDPRQVTEAEARKFYEDLGYTPTKQELAQFVGQGGSSFEKTAPKRVETYVDPRMVDANEVSAAYADLGLSRPTDADIQSLIGQYMETDLTGRAEENLPTARYNSIMEILDNFTGEVGVSDEMREALETVKGDMIDALGDLGLEVAAIDRAVTDVKAAVDALPVGASPEDVSAAINDAISGLENLSAEDVNTAITTALGDMNNLSADDVQGIVDAATGTLEGAISELETDLTKLIEDNAGDVDTALAELAADLGTTEEALLAELDTTKEALSDQFTAGLSALETDLTKLIEDNAGDVDTALAELAADLGTTEEALLAELDTTKEALSDQFTAGLSALEEDIGGVATGVDDLAALVEEYEASGVDRDTAMSLALEQLSTELGQTEADILAELGLTEAELGGRIDASTEQLSGELANAKTDLLALIEANEAAGMTRDEATQTAIGELANAFDVGRTELLTAIDETEASLMSQIGDVETSLGEQITDVETNLGADIQTVADLIGKPAREVTQTDVDFVIDLIAQENVAAETIQQYDVTGDGVLDINDQNMLEGALQGDQDITFADTSMFDPATGLYLQQETDTQTTLDAIIDMNTQINTNIDTSRDILSKEQNVNAMMQQITSAGDAAGQQVTVKTPDPMNIDYLYDIGGESIFATPSQAQLFGSPYGGTRAERPRQQIANTSSAPSLLPRRASGFAKGGQVEDETDMLLRILGDM